MADDTKNLEQLTDSKFTDEVLKTPGLVLLDFYADWCGPCMQMLPTVKTAAVQYDGKMRFYKIDADNVDECGGLLAQYKVRSIPTYYILNIKGVQPHADGEKADVDVEIIEKIVGSLDGLTFLQKIEEAVKKMFSDEKVA